MRGRGDSSSSSSDDSDDDSEEEEEEEEEQEEEEEEAAAGGSGAAPVFPQAGAPCLPRDAARAAAVAYMVKHHGLVRPHRCSENNDECETCLQDGTATETIDCNFCNAAYHNTAACIKAHGTVEHEKEADEWACPECWDEVTGVFNAVREREAKRHLLARVARSR